MSDMSPEDKETEVEIINAVRASSDNPVTPTRLTGKDDFCFSCHSGVSCWNECCHGADITLTPFDILSLSRRLDLRPSEFLLEYTVPDMWERAELPVAKMKMSGADGKGACSFMTDEGCSVYDDRPVTCRYYPLGSASVKMKGDEEKQDFFFLVKEDHCQGHKEDKKQTVADFRSEQGVGLYDEVNRGWIDILMKMASWKNLGGPHGKDLAPQVKQMFFMVSTDVDALRKFVFETKFLDTYEIDEETVEILKINDEALLQLGFDWMQNVMFQEETLSLKKTVLQGAIAKARNDLGAS